MKNIAQYTDKIISMYTSDGLNTVQIAKILGCSDSSVGRLLAKNNIPRIYKPYKEKTTPKDNIEICKLYVDGMTTEEIGRMYSVTDNTIAKILRKNGVCLRKAIRRSLVTNHDYFAEIDSPDKAYFLGWMITDGSIIRSETRPDRRDIISLEIVAQDIKVLKLFANAIGAPESIVKETHTRQGNEHCYMHFTSQKMSDDLSQYGVVRRKTWTTYLPILKEELMPHLIRGIFDGNGTITIDKYGYARFAFFGSENLCVGIRDYLESILGFPHHKVSKSTCYHVWYSGKKDTPTFFNYIYNNCGDYFLDRKREKFLKAK
jgi:intein-encoded DNA endonuclease-like protein